MKCFVFFAAETVETLNLKKKNKRKQLSTIFISFKSRIYDFWEKNEFGGNKVVVHPLSVSLPN